jgi:hypothetical protein
MLRGCQQTSEMRAAKRRKTELTPIWAIDLKDVESAAVPFHLGETKSAEKWIVSSAPFPLLHLPGLFTEDFLLQVKAQLAETPYFARASDLFSYSGTHALEAAEPDSAVGRLHAALYSSEFLELLEVVTGIQLTNQVDMSSHIYKQGQAVCVPLPILSKLTLSQAIFWRVTATTLWKLKTLVELPSSFTLSILLGRKAMVVTWACLIGMQLRSTLHLPKAN